MLKLFLGFANCCLNFQKKSQLFETSSENNLSENPRHPKLIKAGLHALTSTVDVAQNVPTIVLKVTTNIFQSIVIFWRGKIMLKGAEQKLGLVIIDSPTKLNKLKKVF